MSRTQQKLEAMSAQERMIQEKKRQIEERMRAENTMKQVNDTTTLSHMNTHGNQKLKNDATFTNKFQTSVPHTSNPFSTGIPHPSQDIMKDSSSLGSSWFQAAPTPPFPIPIASNVNPPPLVPPAPFSGPNGFFPPPPFLPNPAFPLPPPPPSPAEFLSQMLQTPPPPLPVPPPPPTMTVNPIKDEDLYDPLKAEDDDDDTKLKEKQTTMDATVATADSIPTMTTTSMKPAVGMFKFKKAHTIKIETNLSSTTSATFSSLENEHQKHDNGGSRRHQVATTSADLSASSSALWWKDDDECNDNEQKPNKRLLDEKINSNNRKRKSRWGGDEIKQEPTEHKFVQQIQDATQKAKDFVAQINEQMKLYPEGYGSSDEVNDKQRGQYAEQKELQTIYQTMMNKRRDLEKLAKQQKKKYEYDSDEEMDPELGTWEHKLRTVEMDITREWALKLTDMAKGKHHIGDFIPPHELDKFMKTYSALKEGKTPDVSDYQDFKIQAENIGYRLLAKLGWKEGQGLGKNSQGIAEPVSKGKNPINNAGFGQDRPSELNREDDEFEVYRKRMMLGYRFRPNPLNNPRRDYY